MLYNIYRDPKKTKPLDARDFMVTGKPQVRKAQTPEEMEKILDGWAAYAEIVSKRQGQPPGQ
jgi:hypothetical protein